MLFEGNQGNPRQDTGSGVVKKREKYVFRNRLIGYCPIYKDDRTVYGYNRRCRHQGCITILRPTHKGSLCSVHQRGEYTCVI